MGLQPDDKDAARRRRWVAATYAIGPVTAIRPLWVSTYPVYELTAGNGRYAVKLYRPGWQTENDIRWELDLLEHLSGSGIRVAPALRARGRQIRPPPRPHPPGTP